jgi:hypothetical protein
MIKKILFFAFITISFAFAQSPDTLYQDEAGNYYKVVYKTAEGAPVESGDDLNTVVQNQDPAALDLTYNIGVDSVAYYQNLVSRYTSSGNKLRKTGNILLGVGIPVTIVGLVLYTVGFVNLVEEESDDDGYYYYDDEEESDGSSELMFISGYTFMSLGIAAITVSIPLKIIGSSKLKRAKTQQRNLDNYKVRNNISFTILPGYNPVEKQTSINLALQF